MKRIAYADAVVGTAPRVADLVLQYATELARIGTADSVTIPAHGEDGAAQQVSLLLGPASQITVTEDGEPFDEDVTAAVADLERRIAALTAPIPPSEAPFPGLDDLDDPEAQGATSR